MCTIYVQLLDEGTIVYRPVSAKQISEDIYEILGDDIYDTSIESWEFPPRTKVVVKKKILSDGEALVAVSKLE